MTSILDILSLLLTVALWIILIHFIMSWLLSFQVLNQRQPLVAQVWQGLGRLLNPVYSRIRRYLPDTGALDLSPMVLILIIYVLLIILRNNRGMFL